MIQANNVAKFNYCKFGNYKSTRGKNIVLIDPNGDAVSGYEMHQPIVSLDINDEDDRRIYEFLKDHPLIKGKFTINDMRATEEKNAELSLLKAESITTASSIQDRDLRDFAILMNISTDLDNKLIKAKIIQFSNDNPNKFLEIASDADKMHRVFLKKALAKKALTKINGVWKHNSMSIGLTDDAAIVWLKDNGDMYAILKNQVRGNTSTQQEDIVVADTKNDNIMSSSTISALENDTKEKGEKV
tara:strand:- start:212 stop:943 length:732 start_codon:yes stop_codon:yes gene_type:complete